MAFQDLWNELIGHVPSLSPFLAQRFVNRAWREIRQLKSWSFLLADGHLIVPPVISNGLIGVTQFSTTVTLDATAIATLALAGTNPPIGDRQLRVSAGSRVYNIASYTGGGTLELEEPYQEDTDSSTNYEILSVYFKPPSDDFVRFLSIRDLVTNYHIRLNYTQREIDLIDPQRSTTGDPLYLLAYKVNSSNIPLFELWPTPDSARSYQAYYQKRGTDLANPTDELPPVIPSQLVLDKALYHTYMWAESAKGSRKELMGSDWRFLASEADRRFREQLVKTMREDEDIYMQTIHFPESRSGFLTPIDANYAMNHVVDWG